MRVPNYVLFIRSIRIRYLSGILIFALASGGIMFALNQGEQLPAQPRPAQRSDLVELTRDLKQRRQLRRADDPQLVGRDTATSSAHRRAAMPSACTAEIEALTGRARRAQAEALEA